MIHFVIGTKAQLIKMAPVVRTAMKRGLGINLVFTGQHLSGMEELREDFVLPPWDHRLGSNQRDVASLAQMARWVPDCLSDFRRRKREVFPRRGIVVVHGDTFSTVLGAFMGKRLKWPVAHVESGLRSYSYFHPFPEEITRIVTFKLADYLFAPGGWAVENLRRERGEVIDTRENTLLDSLRFALREEQFDESEVPGEEFAIATIHRFENIFRKKRLQEIVEIIVRISAETRIVFVLHAPTLKRLRKYGLLDVLERAGGVELRPRYTYFAFIHLMKRARFIVSDGGSNQEETAYLDLPCLLLRHRTERREGLGRNVCLSGFDEATIGEFVAQPEQWKGAAPADELSPSEIVIDGLEKALRLGAT